MTTNSVTLLACEMLEEFKEPLRQYHLGFLRNRHLRPIHPTVLRHHLDLLLLENENAFREEIGISVL